jgi:eukaryotic-like serine/threonine-protein kinase
MTAGDRASAPVASGDLLAGKYRVDRVLGAGGMGVVVAATHTQLDQKVALKFMLPELIGDRSIAARFDREARAVVKIQNEHVARIMDVGTLENGAPFMVMEYLEGSDLSQVLKAQGKLPVQVAVDYVLQACEALAEAHVLGIVHRDLKPANLFLTRRPDGSAFIKVLDFGISKATLMTDTGADLVTQASSMLGSPRYMSPEQLTSPLLVDGRSDVWSMGLVLYELLTGQTAFVASTLPELCVAILQHAPQSAGVHRGDLPAGLDDIVLRCLEKDPERRFGSMGDLALALAPFAPAASQVSAQRAASTAGIASSFGRPGGELAPPAGAVRPSKTPLMHAPPGPPPTTPPTLGGPPMLAALPPTGPHYAATTDPGLANPSVVYEHTPMHAVPRMGPPLQAQRGGSSWAVIALVVMVAACVLGLGGCLLCTCAALGRSEPPREGGPEPFQRPPAWSTVNAWRPVRGAVAETVRA